MKVVISLCTLAASLLLVSGAPSGLLGDYIPEPVYYGPMFRPRRSSYGSAYAAPCGGSLPILPSGGYGYGGGHGAYGGGLGFGAGAHGIGGGYGGGYGAPHYRADEADTEILNFSDSEQGMSEHQPMARYGGYGAGVVAAHGAGLGYGALGSGLNLAAGPAIASGPALGVFPNANVGGCNVPLLLSCSPSIVPGRLVKSGYGHGVGAASYGGGAGVVVAAPAYRGTEEQPLHHEEHPEDMSTHSLEHSDDSTQTESHQ